MGLGDARAPRRRAAAGRPGPRAGARRRCWPRRPGSGTSLGARPLRRRPRPERWSSPACGAASAPGSRCRSTSPAARCRSSTCSASRPARALVSVPRGHDKAFAALCAEHGRAVRADRASPTRRAARWRCTASSGSASTSCARRTPRRCRALFGGVGRPGGGPAPARPTTPSCAATVGAAGRGHGARSEAAADAARPAAPTRAGRPGRTRTGPRHAASGDPDRPTAPDSAEALAAAVYAQPGAGRPVRLGARPGRPSSAGSAPPWWWWTCSRSPPPWRWRSAAACGCTRSLG